MPALIAALALAGTTVVPDSRSDAGWLFRFFFYFSSGFGF